MIKKYQLIFPPWRLMIYDQHLDDFKPISDILTDQVIIISNESALYAIKDEATEALIKTFSLGIYDYRITYSGYDRTSSHIAISENQLELINE